MVWLLNLWFLFWYFDFRYWLYAAAKLKCLLVTNDEMRDHIFELLSNSFFQKWKERHQVRFTFVKGCLKLEMPPPFSVVIQVSYNLISNFDVFTVQIHIWICVSYFLGCKFRNRRMDHGTFRSCAKTMRNLWEVGFALQGRVYRIHSICTSYHHYSFD